MKKSRLLIFIESQSLNSNNKVSMALFFGTTLKAVVHGIDPTKFDSDAKSTEELAAVKELFDKRDIIVSSTLEKWLGIEKTHRSSFYEMLFYERIIDQFSAKGVEELTLDMVCGAILDEPTDEIKRIIVSQNSDGSPENVDELRAMREEFLARLQNMSEDSSSPDKEANEEKPEPKAKKTAEEPKLDLSFENLVEKTEEIGKILKSKVFGQNHAINTFLSGYFQDELMSHVLENRTKPRSVFLFAGSPGVGKTYLAEESAKALGLPFLRMDMSEYSNKEATEDICGSDRVYKNSHAGVLTTFVQRNPRCVVLFDEVEKCHIAVIHLFLQILDAGRLRDAFLDKEISFTDTVLIFTTNAGRKIYEDDTVNIASMSPKSVIKAIAEEINPVTHEPAFPAALCSRFAASNVVMFNRMSASFLLKIANSELKNNCEPISKKMGIDINIDTKIPYALLFSIGASADARTVKGRSGAFIYQELYELFRLVNAPTNPYDINNIKSIEITMDAPKTMAIKKLFERPEKANVLVFADDKQADTCKHNITNANVFNANNMDDAKKILDEQVISLVLSDINFEQRGNTNVLNVEDISSLGMDFFNHVITYSNTPVYVLENDSSKISEEEKYSLATRGAKGTVRVDAAEKFDEIIDNVLTSEYLQQNLNSMARANKVLSYNTAQKVNKKGDKATICLSGLTLVTAVDAGDTNNVLSNVDVPNTRFDDVIGAKDAKEELRYFIDYLKDPVKFSKRGVKPPKGILLYGPPGTGKTLLAKALAGESGVTFLKSAGNEFLMRYVGEGPAKVHELFRTARKYSPSILFIDEIDAIGKARGKGAEESHSDDVLTALLTEMDGFSTDASRPVFVLAATNYSIDENDARSLDPALLRRFDRRILVDLPNKEERKKFIKKKLAKIKNHAISDNEIENIASRSAGDSLATLDSVIELALRNVFKTEECVLTDAILEEAFETFMGGEAKKWSDDSLLSTARHEAGHALISWLAGDKPSYVTIVARGSHGGYMQHADDEDKGTYTKKELLGLVRTSLGGRAAELVYYGEDDGLTTGASSDLANATRLMESIICRYGMDDKLGLASFAGSSLVGDAYREKIRMRINEELQAQLEQAKELIAENKKAIDALVEKLLVNNALKGDEIDKIFSANVKKK